MKLIIAIVRPEKLAAVQAAIDEREASLMAVSQVLADQREPGCTGIYRGSEFHIRWLHLRLEIAVDDWGVDAAVAAILHAGSTGAAGQVGDCKVYVIPLDTCVASAADLSSARERAWPWWERSQATGDKPMAHVGTDEPHKTKGGHDETPDSMATEPGPRMVPALDCPRGRVAVGLRRLAATPRCSPHEGRPAYPGYPGGCMSAPQAGSMRHQGPPVIAPGQ